MGLWFLEGVGAGRDRGSQLWEWVESGKRMLGLCGRALHSGFIQRVLGER
jgi:hypothetical protein